MSKYTDGVERVILRVEKYVKASNFRIAIWEVTYMRMDEDGGKRSVFMTGADELDVVKRFPDHVNYNLDIHKFDAGHTPTMWKGV